MNDINLVTLGEVNCSTIKSLLSSKGDIDRTTKSCDYSTISNKQQAFDIKASCYNIVGRYLMETARMEETRKFITFDEIDNIVNANLNIFPIY